MTDKEFEARLDDHDLLILIAERTRVSTIRLDKMEADVGAMKADAANAKGFLSGANWLWGLIVVAPGGLALFMGLQ